MDLSRYSPVYMLHFLPSWSTASAASSSTPILLLFALFNSLCDFPLHHLHRSTRPCPSELLSAPLLSLSGSLPPFVIALFCSHTVVQSLLLSLSKLHCTIYDGYNQLGRRCCTKACVKVTIVSSQKPPHSLNYVISNNPQNWGWTSSL